MMDDPDFPAPAAAREDHEARRDSATLVGLEFLEVCAGVSPSGAAWAAYEWLFVNKAGLPVLSLIDGQAREDARFWAETASPAELECYALAALDRLHGGPFATRHIKRVIAALWGRMSPAEQDAFKNWTQK